MRSSLGQTENPGGIAAVGCEPARSDRDRSDVGQVQRGGSTRPWPSSNREVWKRFEKIRPLGQGATGHVFEVMDRRHNARCALKQLRTDRGLLSHRQVVGFKDEFRELNRLSHPNLARIYELLAVESELYLLMELVEGVDFICHLSGRQFAPSAATTAPETATEPDVRSPDIAPPEIMPSDPGRPQPLHSRGSLRLHTLRSAMAQLASGVLALHAAGRIHCDLKPDNILVDHRGRVVIIDFGLLSMRACAGPPRVCGTPHYMAPEQLDGRPRESSDWYAFGVVLYLALTGRLPFSGTTHAMQQAKLLVRPIDPRQLDPWIPDDLAQLCMQLLVADPEQRPPAEVIGRTLGVQTAAVLQRALQPWPLIGRDAELKALHRAFHDARRYGPRTLSIQGGAGTGKTALLDRFLSELEQTAPAPRILRSACHPDATVPCNGWDGIMDGVAADPSSCALLDDLERAALCPLFSIFGRETAALEVRAHEPSRLHSRAMIALKGLFARLTRAAMTVLCIDDLQWADDLTMTLLSELTRSTQGHPFLLVLCHRGPLPARLTRVQNPTHRREQLHMRPLSAAAVRAHLGSTLPWGARASSELDRLTAECGGNPALLRYAYSAAPWRPAAHARGLSLDQVLRAHLSRLPAVARSYLELVCVAQQPLSEPTIAALLGASGAEALQAKHTLKAARLIGSANAEPGAVEPYNHTIRQHVLRAIPCARLQAHRAQLAPRPPPQPLDRLPIPVLERNRGASGAIGP